MKYSTKYNNRSKSKGKGNGAFNSSQNTKKELKFAPVSGNANFASYSTVKDAYLLEIQNGAYKSKSILVKAITEEQEPNWEEMEPKKLYASWDAANTSMRQETFEEMQARIVQGNVQPNAQPNAGVANRTRHQQQQDQQNAAEVPALPDDIVQMVKHIQTTLDAKWNIEMKNWHEKKSEYKNDVLGAYSTLWTKFITSVLQKRIEQLPDYSTRIHNNPIALLIEIKSQINENTATEHPAMSMVKALKRLLNVQQEWDMSVADYLKDYKAKRDVLEAQAGITLFQHFAEVQYAQEILDIKADSNKSAEAKKKDIQLFIESGMEQVYAHILLMGADRHKYGSLMKRLRSDYGRGVQDEVYPADVESVVKTLNTHTWDPEYKTEKQR